MSLIIFTDLEDYFFARPCKHFLAERCQPGIYSLRQHGHVLVTLDPARMR